MGLTTSTERALANLKKLEATKIKTLSYEEEFRAVLDKAGFDIDGKIKFAGKPHHARVAGGKEGLYIANRASADRCANGVYVSDKTAFDWKHWYFTGHVLSKEQISELRETRKRELEKKAPIQEENYQDKAVEVAEKYYSLKDADKNHSYIIKNRLDYCEYKQDKDGHLYIACCDHELYLANSGAKSFRSSFAMLQVITPDGDSHFEGNSFRLGQFSSSRSNG